MALLHGKLTYQIRGLCYEIQKQYGGVQKEIIYQRALDEKLHVSGLLFQREPKIPVYSKDSGTKLGHYQPDFLIQNAIIVELKARPFISVPMKQQLYDYLRNSEYEVGLLVNFSPVQCKIIRLIHTQDRKAVHKNI